MDVRGPVSRVLWPPFGGRRSFLWDRPRDRPRTTYPEGLGAGHPLPSLFGLSPGGVCPASPVTRTAVRSYRTISPLPAGKRVSSQAVSFLWHFPWPRGRLLLATTLTRSARTFLPEGDPPSDRPDLSRPQGWYHFRRRRVSHSAYEPFTDPKPP